MNTSAAGGDDRLSFDGDAHRGRLESPAPSFRPSIREGSAVPVSSETQSTSVIETGSQMELRLESESR